MHLPVEEEFAEGVARAERVHLRQMAATVVIFSVKSLSLQVKSLSLQK